MNIVTVKVYAQLCGVGTWAIYERIRKGTLEYVPNTTVIDIDKYPPQKLKVGLKIGMKNALKKDKIPK